MTGQKARRDFLRLAGVATAGGFLQSTYAVAEPTLSRDLSLANTTCNIKSFGAVGDGKTIDTPAINKAIEAVAAIGGGVVWFPAGVYACYSIRLHNNISLHLDQGAIILAADSPTDGNGVGGYDFAESNQPWEPYQDFGHNHWHNSLIWGEGLSNISICGSGRIWGKGLSKGRGEGPKVETPGVGNKAIALKNCRNVLLRDLEILQGGHFSILATGVDNLTIDNIKIDTNRDGMDIDCCRNVRITNCTVNSPWDDGICLKSSYGLGRKASTENVTISNCMVSGSYQLGSVLDGSFQKFPPDFPVARQGRIKLGTESNGGFKNIAICNCVLDGCKGLALETVDGALLEDIVITNISMRDITDTPLFLRLGSRLRGPHGTTVGVLKRVLISNIVSYDCLSSLPGMIMGVPGHPVEDIQLNNLYLHHRDGTDDSSGTIVPPEQETLYPEANRFGAMPAQGFFIRHAANIDINNVEIACGGNDMRPAFALNDVNEIDLFRIRLKNNHDVPVFLLENVRNFNVSACRGVRDVQMPYIEKGTL